jgi:thiamine-phosphate pyrophosphorylase
LGAAGVHLGQDDLPLSCARKILGHNKIIGISCQTIDQARKAQNEGADYIGFGSIFKTQTKPERNPMNLELLQGVVSEIKIPVFAIGGINLTNLESVLIRGVTNFAVCRAISTAENIESITKSFKSLITYDNKILR